MKTLKNTFAALVLFTVAALYLSAADMQRGITFSDGQTLSASQLHQLVDSATIVPGFVSGKPIATTLASGDTVLLLSGGSLYQISGNSLLYQNSALITGRSEKAVPIAADYLLLWDSVSQTLEKVSAGNLALSPTNLIWLQSDLQPSNATLSTTYLLALNGGTNNRVSLSNLFWLFPYTAPFTNLTAHTAPTNLDEILIWDSKNGTNKQTTLISLATNLPASTSWSNTFDVMLGVSYANPAVPTVVKFRASDLVNGLEGQNKFGASASIVADIGWLPSGTNYGPFALTTGRIVDTGINVSYGLGALGGQNHVWATLVCTNAELGYSVGDEVDVASLQDASQNNVFAFGLNSTNIFCACSSATIKVLQKGTTTRTAITTADWNLKLYWEHFFK